MVDRYELRFDITYNDLTESDDGDLVYYEDYEKLEKENDELKLKIKVLKMKLEEK